MGDFSVEEEEGVVGAGFDRSSLTGRKVGLALGMEVEGRGSPVVYFFFEREGGWERGRGRTDTSFFFFFLVPTGGACFCFFFFLFPLSLSLSLSCRVRFSCFASACTCTCTCTSREGVWSVERGARGVECAVRAGMWGRLGILVGHPQPARDCRIAAAADWDANRWWEQCFPSLRTCQVCMYIRAGAAVVFPSVRPSGERARWGERKLAGTGASGTSWR